MARPGRAALSRCRRFSYDGAGCLTSVEGPGGASLLSLDDAGRPLSTEWAGGGRRHLRDPLGRPRGVGVLASVLIDRSRVGLK